MSFITQLPEWNAEGSEPGQDKKDEGWEAGEKPPADWFNWLFNRTKESLEELDTAVTEIDGGEW